MISINSNKTGNSVLIVIVIALILGAHAPGQTLNISVKPLGLAGESVESSPAFHVFGGKTVELDLAVESPVGVKFVMKANLFQVARGIAAPLAKNLAIAEEVELHSATRMIVRVAVPLPEVKRRTEILVRFQTQIAGDENLVPAGQARLFVYPQDDDEQLRKLATQIEQELGLRLAVAGEGRAIREFLNKRNLPFADAGLELPRVFDKSLLYLAELNADDLAVPPKDLSGVRLIVFVREPTTLPGVYTTAISGGFITKVALPLPDTLSTNPQSQQTFIEILQQSLNSLRLSP